MGTVYIYPLLHYMKISSIRLFGTFFTPRDFPGDARPKLVFVGRSNVGKSSLLNKLANTRRLAHVSATPGKTLSVNYYLVNERFFLVDLPGYGYAKVSKAEGVRVQRLIRDFFAAAREIRQIVLLIDVRRGLMESDQEVLEQIREYDCPVLTILTKCDKVTLSEVNNQIRIIKTQFGLEAIPFSIKTDRGKEEILKRIDEII